MVNVLNELAGVPFIKGPKLSNTNRDFCFLIKILLIKPVVDFTKTDPPEYVS
jgi:hypothetical protein